MRFSPGIGLLVATLSAGLISLIAYIGHGGWSYEGAAAAARLTARFSFLWFVTAWSASALARLWPGGWRRSLLARRRSVGLGFFAAHTVHLAMLLTAIFAFDHATKLVTVVGGGIGYLFIFAMAITSNDASVRRLGARRWRLLHSTGAYVIASIFAFSYAVRLPTNPPLAIWTLALLGAAALVRIAASLKRRNLRAATA